MYKTLSVAALAAVMAMPALASNDVNYGPSAGSREFTLAGTGTSDNNLDHNTIGLSGSYGQYLGPNTSVNLRQSWSYADVPGDNIWLASTRVGMDYHFGQGRLRPFVGLNIGLVYGEGVDTTGIAGPELGLKYYVKPETFVYAQSEYQFFFKGSDEFKSNYDDGSFVHGVGVGFNF